ncbi:MAG: biosynthetic-type acetolactate synthase large subunit [Candidatus Anaerobiospirillum merdipullorum]|uniref:Acetolactate synthase n=1 Tax=Candidatus Anaerobiospirillum merdipullorum TaxID=2838450 RepID=A0A9E2NSG8_9GAMM|nr:biosynthetic-type acetolactate synthase large subunit [Candidatus Anaerobiospirillum merdipullorum]
MEMLNGAQIVVRALEDLGVEQMFGYPGAAVIDIYDELLNSDKITHILARHEQGAVHMADGYARATGKVGCAIVTSGPGATNTVTAIATAYGDSIPLVVITGQVATSLIGSDAFQEVDTVGITRPVVKHSFMCKKAEDIAINIRKAFYIASTGRKGPVVVDIPKNAQNPNIKVPYDMSTPINLRSYNPTVYGHKGQVRRAVKMIAEAKRPVLIFGGGVVQGNASENLAKLVNKMNLPATQTLMGISALPSTDRHNLGMVGMHGTYEANEAMHNSDLVVAIAVRFDDRVTNNARKFCPNAKIIHVDVDPASISKCVHADIPIVGDCNTVLGQMLQSIEEQELQANPELDAWWEQIDKWRARNCLAYEKSDTVIKPQQVIEEVCAAVAERGDDTYITTDVGQHQMFVAQLFKFVHPRHFITSGGLGTMGFGFPAAAGVKVAYPDAQVICFTGDGSFQMNLQELGTCKQYHLPVKIFILDNHTLGMVRQWQSLFYHQRYSQTNLDYNPDFIKLADAYDHKAFKVSDPKELRAVIDKVLAMKDDLVIVDVITDTDSKVFPMQRTGGSMEDMILAESKED